MINKNLSGLCSVISAICLLMSCSSKQKSYTTWEVFGGSKENIHYSTLADIDTSNVGKLEVAWTYHTGDKSENVSLECSPIIVHDILYGISPLLKAFAVDAKTGREAWRCIRG